MRLTPSHRIHGRVCRHSRYTGTALYSALLIGEWHPSKVWTPRGTPQRDTANREKRRRGWGSHTSCQPGPSPTSLRYEGECVDGHALAHAEALQGGGVYPSEWAPLPEGPIQGDTALLRPSQPAGGGRGSPRRHHRTREETYQLTVNAVPPAPRMHPLPLALCARFAWFAQAGRVAVARCCMYGHTVGWWPMGYAGVCAQRVGFCVGTRRPTSHWARSSRSMGLASAGGSPLQRQLVWGRGCAGCAW